MTGNPAMQHKGFGYYQNLFFMKYLNGILIEKFNIKPLHAKK
jgi:hypothetical protein